jgi:hypothetical protein
VLSQLRIILAAEAEARRTVEAARTAAAAEVGRAEEAARRLVADARAARDTVARAVEAGLVAAAEAEAQRFEAAAQQRIADLAETAKLRREAAVAAITERVLACDEEGGSGSADGPDANRCRDGSGTASPGGRGDG